MNIIGFELGLIIPATYRKWL